MIRKTAVVCVIVCAAWMLPTACACAQDWISLKNSTEAEFARGEYASALVYAQQALTQAEREFGINHINYSTSLSDLALIRQREGAYSEAERLFQEAAKIRKQRFGESNKYYAVSLHNLAGLYYEMGQYEIAHTYCLKALSVREAIGGKQEPGYVSSVNLLIVICQQLNNTAEADSLSRVLSSVTAGRAGDAGYAAVLNTRGIRLFINGEYDEAEKVLTESLQLIEKTSGKETLSYADAANNLGSLCKSTHQYDKALRYYRESVAIRGNILNKFHPSYSEAIGNLAALLSDMQRWSEARELYTEQNANILRQIREYFPGLSENEKASFWNKTKHELERFYFFASSHCAEDSLLTCEMYDLQLATKALLLNSFSKVKRNIFNGGDDSARALYRQWKSTREALSRSFRLAESDPTRQGIDRDSLEDAARRMERELSRKASSFAAAFTANEITWKDVRAALKPHEAAMEIIRFQYFDRALTDTIHYAALIVTPSSAEHPEIVIFDNGKMMEDEYFNNYARALRSPEHDEISYRQYWQKIAEKMPGITKVFLSADGVYNQINIQSLQPSAHTFLIDSLDVVLVGNTKRLVDTQPIRSVVGYAGKSAVLFGAPDFDAILAGDPAGARDVSPPGHSPSGAAGDNAYGERLKSLPETEREVVSITAILAKRMREVRTYIGTQATEENLAAEHGPAILHIATHGFFNDVSNDSAFTRSTDSYLLRSMLMFAGANRTVARGGGLRSGNDGVLTAYEATDLDLDSTELVILSACETGKGRIVNGEGVYGFQRSFEAAGAKNVILSLWKVDDTFTRELMVCFYRRWLEMDDKHAAFRAAVLELKQQYPRPYDWAAFLMTGR